MAVPGAADTTAVDAVDVLDSESGITTMSVGIANKLESAFPDGKVVGGMLHPGKLELADGRVLVVDQKTCPVQIALHTSWGLVTLGPFSFAVMPRDHDVVILGNAMFKLLSIDVYDRLGALRAGTRDPHRCRHRDVPAVSPSHRQCRRFAPANELNAGGAG